MDEQYIIDLYNQLGGESKFGQFEDFKSLITSDPSYQKDFHNAFGESTLGSFNDFSSLVSRQQQAIQPKKKEDGGFFPNPIEQTQQAIQDLGQMEEAQAQQQGVSLAPQGTFLRQMQRSSLASESAPVPLELPSELEDRKYRAPIEAPTPTEELYKMLLPKDIEEAGAEAIRMNEQVPEFIKPSIDVITPEFINRYSDTVKQELEYQFGPSGFKFEETGPVTIDVIAPNGKRKKIEVGGYTAEQNADDLKVFIKENAAELKGLSDLEKQYIGENKKYTTKKNYDKDIRELTQQAEEFNKEKNDILAEKYSIETEAEKLKLIPSNKRNTPEFAALMQNYVNKVDAFEKKTADYESRAKDFEEQGKQFDKAASKYAEMKATQGGWLKAGFIPNMLNMGYEQIQKGVFDVGVDYVYNVVSEIGATKDLIGKYVYEEELGKKAKELGYTEYNLGYDVTKGLQTEEFDKLSEDKKEKVRKAIVDIDRAIIDSYKKISKRVGKEDIGSMFKNLRLTDVSDEWFQEKEKSILGGGIVGLGKSVPAMIGFSWMRKIFMYAQATNAIQEEMDKNREFDNISEDEKQLIKIPYGIASAALEEFGLRNLIKNQSVVGNLVKRMIGVAPIGASASQMRNIAIYEIKRLGLKSGVPLAGAFLAEAETGAAQQALEFEIKNIYNAVKEKEMFKDVPMSLAEQAYNLRFDQKYVNDVFKAGIQEGIGGFIMKVPSAVTNAITRNTFAEMYDAQFSAFEDMHLDPDARKLYELQLKGKVNSGKMTQKESDEALNRYDRAAGMLRSIPENIVDLSDKKRAMDLIVERQKLEESKKGKDPALVKPIQNKIDSINEQLDKISQDAVQEQTTGEVPVQSEAGVSETMVEGEPQAGPEGTAQKGVLSPEEIKSKREEIERRRQEELSSNTTDINIEENRRPNGSIGTQGFTPEGLKSLIDFLNKELSLNIPNNLFENNSLKPLIEHIKSNSNLVSKIYEYVKKDPVEVNYLPDGTIHFKDGNHRSNLLNLIGAETIPSIEVGQRSEIDKINSKYDTELAALQPTEITATEVAPSTEVAPTTEAKVEFTEQDRARKAELENAMKNADKRKKNITVGETIMSKADVKAELDALNQKEKALKEPAPKPKTEVAPTETAPEQKQRTAEEEADFLETLLGAPRQETTPEGKPKEKPKGKKASDKVRDLKVKGPKGLQSNILGVPIAIWNAAMDTIAAAIDAGVAVSAAIRKGAEYIKKNYKGKWDSNAFNDRVKGSITGARARLSMANSQMPDNRNNEDAIVEEMNNLAPYEVDFQEPSPSDKTKEVDPIKESSSIKKSITNLLKFLKLDKYFQNNDLLRRIQDFNGIPMLLGMSDILAAGTILDSMGGELVVDGGILFNALGRNMRLAWAGVNENGASVQLENAKKVYESNKELFDRLWAEGKLPYGKIPMAIMRMSNTAINSNEAVFRYVLPYLRTLPIENRKAALQTLLESINKKKENDSGANWMEEFSNKLNDGTIQSKEEAIAYLNGLLEGDTNVKRTDSIESFITTITPKTVEFSGENSVIEKLNKKQERVNAYIVSKFIEDNNIETIDEFFDAIAKDAQKRAESKDGKSQLALPQRSYIFDQLFSKEGVGNPNTQFIKDLFKGVENPRKELFTATHIYNAIGEKSMLKSKQGEVVAIMGIDVLENAGVSKAKHNNYGWGPNGSIIALIKNPMHGIDVFPEFRAKASRIFKAKKKAALKPEELSRMEALESALDGIDENATTVMVDGKEMSVKDAKKELAKYNKQQAVELPTMEAVAQQTGGAFFMDKAFVGTTAKAEDIKMLDMLIGKLRYAFPGVSVTYTQEEFDSFMDQEGTKIKQSKDGLIIYGVTKDGKIFLNPAAQSLRTPIHEFGHIWIDFLRSKASGKKGDMLLKKGFDLVRGTPEHLHAIELYGDSDLALEEALVELIATKGETLINAADRSNFKSWLNAVFKYIQEKFKGFKAVTQVGIKDMSLDDFINVALSDLFSGKEISSKFDPAKESSADYRYSLTQDIQTAIETARKNGISEEGIRTFLKRRGLDEAKINEILGKKTTAKGKAELNEQTLPGYDEMMAKVDAMIARQIKSQTKDGGAVDLNKIAKNLDALLRKFDAYTNATDAQKKALEQEARNRLGADQKRAPSIGRILGAFKDITNLSREEKTIIVNNIMKLAKDAANDLANEIREMKVKGKIKISQFNAIQKRLSKVNFMNETSISTFVEYMTKVFNDVNYAEKIDNANKQLKTAKANIRTKIGVAEVLTPLLKKLFNMDPTLIPMEVFEEYLSVVDMMGKRQTELSLVESQKLTAQVNKILDAVQTELSMLDDLIEMFNEYENKQFNEDGSINFSKTLSEMVKDKKITPDDSDLLKKYRTKVIESSEKTKMTPEQKAEEKKELIQSIREMEVDGNNLPMREEREDASALKELVKTDALESLSNSELKNLYKALNNINNGFLSAYSKKMIRTLNSYNDSKTLDTAIENAGRLPLSRLLAKLKSYLPYQKTAEKISVKKSPLFFIDQVFGNFKDNPIFRTVFERVAKGFDNYKTDIKIVQEKLDKAFNKVASHYWKNPNKVKMSTFKMMTYALQLEYETNKDSGEFYSAADYILETIDHAMSNDSTLSPYDVAILNKILKEFGKVVGKDENGKDIIDIDMKKLYDSFVDVEKDAIKTIQEVNVSLRDKALYTSAVIRGDKVKVFDNYVHHSVLPTGFVDKTKTGTITAQTQSQNMDPSTRAKSLTERTRGVKPLNFNIFSVTQKGANQVLMDFHLTEPVRTTRKTLSETKKKIKERKNNKQSEVFNAIEMAFEVAFDNVLMNTYQDDSFATSVVNFMTKQAYRSILASSGRWVSELLSNLSFVALVDPKAYYNGATKYRGVVMSNLGPQVMRSVNSTVQDRTYAGALLSGKMIDSNIMDQAVGLDGSPAKNAVANVIQTIHNNSTKKYGNFVAATADTLISTPDKMMIRPFWFGVFANNFKDATGQEVDFNKIAENNEQYMNEFKEAIEYSRKTADQMVVFAGTTNNPFMSRQAGQNVKGMNEFAKIFNNFNNFMNNFIIYEFITARTGIYAAMGNGMISRRQGAFMLGGVVLRTTLYSYLINELGGSLLSLFFKAPEEDEEEKKEKSVLGKVGKAVAGSMTSLILGRDFGNMTRSMINYGVESVNEKYIQQFFDNEYTLDDAITYSVIPRTNRPEFVDLMINMSGPMQPYLRTSKKTFDRIMQDPPKKPDAIKRREQDIYFNIPFEWAGNLGIVPLYKDVKKTITPYLKNEVNKITTEMESQRRKTIYEGYDTEKEFKIAEPKLYREKAKRGGDLYEYKKKVRDNLRQKKLENIKKIREMRSSKSN